MSSEKMTRTTQEQIKTESAGLTGRPQRQIKTESVLFAIAGVAGLTGLVLSLRSLSSGDEKSDDKIWMADPPPIFIKSGSFVIESDETFNHADNRLSRPTEEIRTILIHKYNERGIPDVEDSDFYGYKTYPNRGDFKLKIWLQFWNNQNGTWSAFYPNSAPEIDISCDKRNSGFLFSLEYKSGKLKKSKKKPKNRPDRYEDEEDQAFRFRRIQIELSDSHHYIIDTMRDGDQYTIGFSDEESGKIF